MYHFRFKCKYDNKTIYLDIPENSTKGNLPTYNDAIYLKVLRISWTSNLKYFKIY